jgi:predicted enzyme related to lactoylglutathione lyase
LTEAGGQPGGAIYPAQSGERGPIVYYDTEDIDAHVARINELGGRADGKQAIPGVGWFARAWGTGLGHRGKPLQLVPERRVDAALSL